MPDKLNDLKFWSKGDVLTADRLNEMVCRINNVSLMTVDDGVVGKAESSSSNFQKGRFNRDVQKMHTEDGIGKIIDSFVIQGNCEGNYARKNGVNTWTKHIYDDICCKEILPNDLNKIGEITDGTELYQEIKFDRKGNVTSRKIVQYPPNCRPENRLWDYIPICADCQRCGVLYNRLSRVAVDCRVACAPQKSSKYTTIRTNDFFMPPVPMNADSASFRLLKNIDGNTIPVRGLRGEEGTVIVDCDSFLEIRSGVAFGANNMPTFNRMGSPACVKWTENFGFKITPNKTDNPYLFNIETFGSPSSAHYQAGCAIVGGDLQAGIISVRAAHSASSQKGYVYKISSDSSITEPIIQNGHIKIPKMSGPSCSYNFSCWFCVDCQTNTVFINEEKLGTVAANLAGCISSSIVTTSTTTLDNWMDETNCSSGQIRARIDTTSGESATANIYSFRS